MNIPKGYKLVPINPTAEMIEAAFVGKVEAQSVQHQQRARDAMGRDYQAIVAATPEPPAFDGEPSVIAFASFATNGNLRCWSSDCEAVGLKVIAEGGGPITALIDRDHLRFHARVSEQVEAHLSQQIDILTIDLNAARARIDLMVEALEKTLTLRGTLELHGILGQVEQAIGPRYETATELDELFKPGNGNAARRRADGVSKGCDQPQAHPARCGCEGKANG